MGTGLYLEPIQAGIVPPQQFEQREGGLFMRDAMQLFLYGICALGICTVVIGFCSAVKSLCRKFMRRGEDHDGK